MPINHRNLAKRIKYVLPEPVFNVLRRILYWLASIVPHSVKYWVGSIVKRNKYPYCVIRDGDIVVQVGAPRDLIEAGRSRAIYFSNYVGRGKVIICEPDPDNCRAIKETIARYDIGDRIILVEKGLWFERGELGFYSSPDHPASNVLVDAKDFSKDELNDRHYSLITVPVDTLDNVAEELGLSKIRLVSLTTNGAEKNILAGMKNVLTHGVDYIALASTGSGYSEMMENVGYCLVAIDDRGYTFHRAART